MAQKQPKTKLLRMRTDALKIHPTAQRSIIPSHLKRLTEHLDLDAIGTFHVVKYPIRGVEHYWIVDGQHRYQALIDNNFGEWVVDVMLHVDINDDAGANKLFRLLNNRKSLTAYERFMAEHRAGWGTASGVWTVCRRHKLQIKPATADGCVACVDRLKRLYEHDKGRTLDATFTILRDAWGCISASLEGMIVEGLGRVLTQYEGRIDIAALVQKLAKYPGGPGALHGAAKGLFAIKRSSVSRCVSDIIIDQYNSGRRGASRLG